MSGESRIDNQTLRERLQAEIDNFGQLEERLGDPDLASNPLELKDVSRKHVQLSARVARFKEFLGLMNRLDEARELLAAPDSDAELKEFARDEARELEEKIEGERNAIELLLIPPDPNDGKNVIVEIRAGTGGEEAALFVGDLFKMYIRFAEQSGLKVELISTQETGIGGYKEVIFSVQGSNAFKLFHLEAGGHRVQRIPVTESGGRIHTSAVTVAVMPEAEEEEVEIDEKDLKVDTFRASGAGGQHVNKTDSAVRMLHIPSGIVVSCQDERSQLKNRARALRVLRARLQEVQEYERKSSASAEKKKQVGSGDRSQRIRTYNFPQGRITDHRAGYTAYNLEGVMGGDMEDLVEAGLSSEREEKLKELNL